MALDYGVRFGEIRMTTRVLAKLIGAGWDAPGRSVKAAMLLSIRKPVFIARQRVELSGIYRVIHDRNHVRAHLVTAAQGTSFPQCRNKSCHPRFVLLRTAPLLHEHPEFVG